MRYSKICGKNEVFGVKFTGNTTIARCLSGPEKSHTKIRFCLSFEWVFSGGFTVWLGLRSVFHVTTLLLYLRFLGNRKFHLKSRQGTERKYIWKRINKQINKYRLGPRLLSFLGYFSCCERNWTANKWKKLNFVMHLWDTFMDSAWLLFKGGCELIGFILVHLF